MKKKILTSVAVAAVLSSTAASTINSVVSKQTPSHTVKAATNQTSFLNKAARQAQKAAKSYGVFPSVMIAQAIVESAWGQSGLAVNANNLFGMKADDGWNGAVYSSRTREEDSKGKSYYITANFRKYASFEQSFDDNGRKLRFGVTWQPSRYAGAWIENASSYAAATKALTGTYATDHRYNTTLNSRITAYNLTKYDPKISKARVSYKVTKNSATYVWPTDHNLSNKKSSVKKGQHVTVDKTITYFDKSKRMHIVGKGWVNSDVFAKKSALPASQAPKAGKTKKMLMHNAIVYDNKGKRNKKYRMLKADQVLTTYGRKTIKGRRFYVIGKNKNIAAGNIDATYRLLKHNAYVYNGSGNRDNALLYKKGRGVATYGNPVKIMKKGYYKIGIHQYIKIGNFAK